jgi:hypothetical protein
VCAFRRVKKKKKIAELGSISFRSRVNKRIPHLTPLDVGIFSFRRRETVRIDSGADDVIARFFLYCNKEEGRAICCVCRRDGWLVIRITHTQAATGERSENVVPLLLLLLLPPRHHLYSRRSRSRRRLCGWWVGS